MCTVATRDAEKEYKAADSGSGSCSDGSATGVALRRFLLCDMAHLVPESNAHGRRQYKPLFEAHCDINCALTARRHKLLFMDGRGPKLFPSENGELRPGGAIYCCRVWSDDQGQSRHLR